MSSRRARLALYLDVRHIARLQDEAETTGASVSFLIRRILNEHFGDDESVDKGHLVRHNVVCAIEGFTP